MKKGVIIEMKGKQKVILADNGRFYIANAKNTDRIGDRVKIPALRKKITALSLIASFFVLAFSGGYYAVNEINAKIPNTLIQIEINPSIEFLINSQSKVLSVAPLNEDGVIVSANEDFIGLSIGDAVEKFINISVLCGFIDFEVSCNPVYVYSLSDNKEDTEKINQTIKNQLENFFKDNYIKAIVLNNIYSPAVKSFASAYDCEAEKLSALYTSSNILKQNGDHRSFKDIMQDLKSSNVKELCNIIRQAHIKYEQNLKSENKHFLIQNKNNLRQENEDALNSFKSKEQNRQDFYTWLEIKNLYEKTFTEDNITEFRNPFYVTELNR